MVNRNGVMIHLLNRMIYDFLFTSYLTSRFFYLIFSNIKDDHLYYNSNVTIMHIMIYYFYYSLLGFYINGGRVTSIFINLNKIFIKHLKDGHIALHYGYHEYDHSQQEYKNVIVEYDVNRRLNFIHL